MIEATVKIILKHGVADPEGKTTAKALRELGFEEVRNVSSIKTFEIELEGDDPVRARERVERMCRMLLANPVIQEYHIEIKANGDPSN
ncbi:phosphoribosylformylglycinamidine synthase PurS protein [Methanosarcinales archaeon]|nr:MAG: phosphoribosylformylglycinamidine synthase PurS protein [Methanosarcinales archaeon]